ncbi:MAG: IMP cyclohydrolase [Patescibacteria group bacterium]
MELEIRAKNNLLALKQNPYPGRGIIVGMDETGKYLIQVYWIMGRSENSRNRVFVIEDNGVLKTAPFDPAKVKDPSLIIYTAMAEILTHYAVSNGHQTLDALSIKGLDSSLKKWEYEPDSPNYTPRISALLEPRVFAPQIAELSILKKSPFSDMCNRYLYKLDISSPGLGYCITTYNGDGNPLPSFTGDPYLIPLTGGIEDIAQTFWDSLNKDNKVSLAVKFIEIDERNVLMTKRNIHEGD